MFFKWPCLHIGCFIPNFNSFGIQIRNILDSEIRPLELDGGLAPGGVFWMNKAILGAYSIFEILKKLWENFEILWT